MKTKEFDYSSIHRLSDILQTEPAIGKMKVTISIKDGKKTYCKKLQIYNCLCAAVDRIYETAKYIADFQFDKSNYGGQAFDFYSFINYLEIIFECTESLFKILNLDFKSLFTKKNFKKSNESRCSDYTFFKFVRSACVGHPISTTRYSKITKNAYGYYPYVSWQNNHNVTSLIHKNNADLNILSWTSQTKCNYKRYYLYIGEFFNFINDVLKSIEKVNERLKELISEHKDKKRCKRLKAPEKFCSFSDYCFYLIKRLGKLWNSSEFKDGGLLLASYIFKSNYFNQEFLLYIKERIKKLVDLMLTDIYKIDYDYIFENLCLYEAIPDEVKNKGYVSEKFHDYLYHEAIFELKNNQILYCERDNYLKTGSNKDFAVNLLFAVEKFLYKEGEFCYKKQTYLDLYVITLQNIYLKTKDKINLKETQYEDENFEFINDIE